MEYDGPAWLSILPPLIAIGLAVVTRHVFVSLAVGVLFGGTILADWNPIQGLVVTISDVVVPSIAEPDNALIIVLLAAVGGFVGVLQRSGAMQAFVEATTHKITNPVRAQLAAWVSGIVIFFSASSSVLVLGPVYQPIFDRVRASREKLAYIVDSTASPVAVLFPISSWAVYVVGLIATQYEDLGIPTSAMATFVQTIPSQYYALGSVALVGLIAVSRVDFGAMRTAEKRVLETGELHREGAVPARSDEPSAPPKKGSAGMMYAALASLLVVVVVAFVWTGGFPAEGLGFWAALGDAFQRGNSGISATLGFLAAVLVAAVWIMGKGTMRGLEIADEWLSGAKEMFTVTGILVFAWSIGEVCKQLGTAAFVTSLVGDTMTPETVPAVIFVVGCLISFATGTSWGSYAILMPIAIPLAHKMGVPIPVAVAAVLSGGLFGDHCSPISDTTVMASISSACDHIEHVRTQMPYALLAALVSAFAFLVAAWTSLWVGLVFTLAALVAIVLFVQFRTVGKPQAA